MKLKALESRVENPHYHTGYSRLKTVGIYAQAAITAIVVTGIISYSSCAGDATVEQPKVENAQAYEGNPSEIELLLQ